MNKSEFRIGEYVQIRSWDDMAGVYGTINNQRSIDLPGYVFTSDMAHLCGKTGHISHISEFSFLGHKYRHFSFYDINLSAAVFGNEWAVTEFMLSKVPVVENLL